jgi:Tfp pilus assembly protein PilO
MTARLSPRDQLIAVAISGVLLLLLGFIFLVRPQLATLGELQAQKEQQMQQLNQYKLRYQQLEAIKQESGQMALRLLNIKRAMPSEPELPSLMIEMQQLAEDSGLYLNNINFGQVADKGGYGEMTINMNVEGSFYSVLDWLQRLKSLSRKVVVDTLSFSVKEYPALSVNITARAFTLKADANTAQPAGTSAPAASSTATTSSP